MNKNAAFLNRLGWAWQGILAAYHQETSFRTQAHIGAGVLILMVVIRPGWLWAAVILILTGMVLMAELFNTALEATLDGLHPQAAPFVKLAKDCAAGAALVASTTAAMVGLFLMLDWMNTW